MRKVFNSMLPREYITIKLLKYPLNFLAVQVVMCSTVKKILQDIVINYGVFFMDITSAMIVTNLCYFRKSLGTSA